jgi:hypothetical protein
VAPHALATFDWTGYVLEVFVLKPFVTAGFVTAGFVTAGFVPETLVLAGFVSEIFVSGTAFVLLTDFATAIGALRTFISGACIAAASGLAFCGAAALALGALVLAVLGLGFFVLGVSVPVVIPLGTRGQVVGGGTFAGAYGRRGRSGSRRGRAVCLRGIGRGASLASGLLAEAVPPSGTRHGTLLATLSKSPGSILPRRSHAPPGHARHRIQLREGRAFRRL